MDKARRSPASLITRSTGREDPRTPVLHADEPPRFPPDATILRVEGMGMAHFGGNALATVSTHRAERGISFGSELRSLLRHRAPPRLGAVQPVRFELARPRPLRLIPGRARRIAQRRVGLAARALR